LYKLLLIPLMLVVSLTMYAQQIDQELAMKVYYKGKYAVNRATHAAVQQLDSFRLADGELFIDEDRAFDMAKQYLYANLLFDANGQPTAQSFIQSPIRILLFEVVNADQTFPYQYENPQYGIRLSLHKPAVVLVVALDYSGIFLRNDPVKWNIVGSSQLIAP